MSVNLASCGVRLAPLSTGKCPKGASSDKTTGQMWEPSKVCYSPAPPDIDGVSSRERSGWNGHGRPVSSGTRPSLVADKSVGSQT